MALLSQLKPRAIRRAASVGRREERSAPANPLKLACIDQRIAWPIYTRCGLWRRLNRSRSAIDFAPLCALNNVGSQ